MVVMVTHLLSRSAKTRAARLARGERPPFAVGAVRLEIDEQRPVEVFYPVDTDAVPEAADAQDPQSTPIAADWEHFAPDEAERW
jgi:hypothetical protein